MHKERDLVYVSGKISDVTPEAVQENVDRMLDAGIGYKIRNPEADMFLPAEANGRIGVALEYDWREFMKSDLNILKRCDTIYMCQGWEDSRGARMEHFLAGKWGIPIQYEMEQGVDYSLILQ